MVEYRRVEAVGATMFFTVVTDGRRPILAGRAIDIFRAAVAEEIHIRPFTIDAAVILPDHLHMIWTLPPGDEKFSIRWSRIKGRFTRAFLAAGGEEGVRSSSRVEREERGVWQRRFWDHVIRDDREFGAFVDYIHFNPVKHGYVNCPHEWAYSSFERWVREGVYGRDWMCGCEKRRSRVPRFASIEKFTGE